MKRILGLTLVTVLAFAARANESAKSTETQPPNPLAAEQGATGPRPNDAEIMTIVSTANQAEVDAAKLAMSTSKNSEVKSFADHMAKEHSKNTQQTMALSKTLKVKPEPASTAEAMAADAKSKIADLKKQSGADFDRSYIDLQVKMHEQVLNDLTKTLIPSAQNPQLKSFLETTKTHVQQHLASAQKIQATLK